MELNPSPDRTNPWGNTFDPSHANTAISYLQFTTALGCYPAGASPVGAQEMAGNVWEWSYSRFEQVHPDYRVVLGGSWESRPVYARCYYRFGHNPKTSYIDRGFRCVIYQDS
jgi:formylglycine-generating enzyme required for sulfatase activity